VTRDEKTLAIATAGLVLAALGAFLPWARIGGRNRSGFATADTFISLSDGALPDVIAWVGRWWYLPAFLAILAWLTVLAHGHVSVRAIGVASIAIAVAMWWLFVWGGSHWGVVNIELTGPIVATTGMLIVGLACGRRRRSVLSRPQ
jgi:hypothetical protein